MVKSGLLRLALGLAFLLLACSPVVSTQEPPPFPAVFCGRVTVGGEPPADGTQLSARVGDYAASSVAIEGGRYKFLNVSPPGKTYLGEKITFLLDGRAAAETVAYQADTFYCAGIGGSQQDFDLTFPALDTQGRSELTIWVAYALFGLAMLAVVGAVLWASTVRRPSGD
ncbi:MAG: hypothetical protein HY685_03770 [Chloroflexi bacterium]|nr:hypothetical protein [Chloroflexota bacterium]